MDRDPRAANEGNPDTSEGNPDSNEDNPDLDAPGGRDEEPVEKRPNVGSTTPGGYPAQDRKDSDPTGG